MPLFEYECQACGKPFEALVHSRTTTAVECPECHSPKVERRLALPALGRVAESPESTNCRGDGPPCAAPWCGRKG